MIKIILLAIIVVLLLMCLLIVRNRLATRLFFICQLVLGALLVIFPEAAQWAADRVGVGRGTDLLLYLLILLCYAGGLVALAKFRKLERQITQLTREIAILRPEKENDAERK